MAVVVVAPHTTAASGRAERRAAPIDDAEDCVEATPAESSVYGVEGDRSDIVLDVHFVLDDLHYEWGQEMVELAAEPFADVGIVLDPTFEEVHFEPTGALADGRPTIDPNQLIEATRGHLGGYRPHGSDVVYTFTAKQLVSSGALGSAVAGQADCIGGVRYPDAAFAVGEIGARNDPAGNKRGGKIAAHEIAHLMGAHHHYANCAEADQEGLQEDLTACTLMFNDLFMVSLRMSTINGAIVRGHALEYANDTPLGPPPLADRAVSLERTRRRIQGGVTSSKPGCARLVEVDVQRQVGRTTWETVETLTTDGEGTFRYRPEAPARLRAVANAARAFEGGTWWDCPETISVSVDF